MDIIGQLTGELGIRRSQTESAVKLIDDGNTVPFIARYRKEATGSLNDEVLRSLEERLTYLRGLEERRARVLQTIGEQGKLTDELKKKIDDAATLVALEDLYLPYRPKRRTRASMARDKGLQELADQIRGEALQLPAIEAAAAFVHDDGAYSPEEALQGGMDIVAEEIAETAEIRAAVRALTASEGQLTSEAKDEDEKSVYETYYHYAESLRKVPGYRVLALNRGDKENILTVKVTVDEQRVLSYLERELIKTTNQYTTPVLRATILDSYNRLLAPAVERDIRSDLTGKAQDSAIVVFEKNLHQLLMQPPIAGRTVLGWDPAFRTGCKLAVVDETGKVLDTAVIYPTAPQNRIDESIKVLEKLVTRYNISLISVGNGTASRESEQIIADFIRRMAARDIKLEYVIVSESGASVYSASKLATEEFPEFDVGQRSAASIARRLQDPLAELVKIDPKSIGVGQYQHDIDEKKLDAALGGVVEDCVNSVGVDLNTASAPLLQYISGITKSTARNIVAWREANGRFTNRRQLLKVSKLGPKAFTQCAGFLRIRGGDSPLDATSVHPESYAAAEKLMQKLGLTPADVLAAQSGRAASSRPKLDNADALAAELGIGVITLRDILSELYKPSRDPREQMPKPLLRSDIMDLKDLQPGMILRGTVRNVIDFGAFVDIGVHQDGLVHISEIADRYIRHPLEVVSVGDIVDVQVLKVDVSRQRIALTMKIKR